MTMKRPLGPVLLAPCLLVWGLLVWGLLLGGCADSSSDVADDPAGETSSPTASPTQSPTEEPSKSPGPLDFQEIALISSTAAGGRVDPTAVRLDDRDARETFLGQFEQPEFGNKIATKVAATTVPEGYALLGAVVAIGCDVPPGVSVTVGPDGWFIEAKKVAEPMLECFAPVTTVAIVAVPA